MSHDEDRKDDSRNKFDLEPLLVACHDLIRRTNTIYDTVFHRKDYALVDKVYGESLSSEHLKSTQLSKSKKPDELAQEMAQKLLAGSLRNSFSYIHVCGDEGKINYTPHDIVVPQKSTFAKSFNSDIEFPETFKKLDQKEITIWIEPLDGEREFYRQHDARPYAVSTSIGIAYKGEPIAAVVGRPFNTNPKNHITWGIVGVGVFGYDNETRPVEKRDKTCYIVAVPRCDVTEIWREYIGKCLGGGYTFLRTFGIVSQFLLVLEGEANLIIFPLMWSNKYQTCAGEALFRSFGGAVSKADGTTYNYGKNVSVCNHEGFVATIYGKEAHDKVCHPEVDAQQVDLMLIGATGFTGKLATKYIIEKYGKNKDFSFAIAGRHMDKLNELKKELSEIDADAVKRLKTYAIDVLSTRSVEVTLPHAAVVVSTVGPYARYGEKIVQHASCFGTDYADITGETLWAKRLSQRYDLNANRSESRAVHFCGVVSFPIDACAYLAVKHLRERQGVIPEEDTIDIEPFFKMKGMESSGGTIESWFNGFKEASKMDLNDPYFMLTETDNKPSTKQPAPGPPVWVPQYNAYGHIGLYSLVDRMVLVRTNCLLDYYYGTNARIHPTKWLTSSWFTAWFVTLMMMVLSFLLKFAPTRAFLGLLRKLFTKAGEGPSLEKMEKAKAEFRVIARSKNKKKAAEVSFTVHGDAGYLNTSKFLIEHGLFMANERKGAARIRKGGFFTPAAIGRDEILKKFGEEKGFELTVKDL